MNLLISPTINLAPRQKLVKSSTQYKVTEFKSHSNIGLSTVLPEDKKLYLET